MSRRLSKWIERLSPERKVLSLKNLLYQPKYARSYVYAMAVASMEEDSEFNSADDAELFCPDHISDDLQGRILKASGTEFNKIAVFDIVVFLTLNFMKEEGPQANRNSAKNLKNRYDNYVDKMYLE
jgi:hypothetical protein